MTAPYRNRPKYGTFYVASGVGDPLSLVNSSFESIEDGVDAIIVAQATEAINALEVVGIRKELVYSGSVSLATGSANLTGSGTSFLSDLVVGSTIFLGTRPIGFTVFSIESNTSVILAEVNTGLTFSSGDLSVMRAYRAKWTDDGSFSNLAIGVSEDDYADLALCRIRTHGLMFGFAFLTPGRPYYLGTSYGSLVDGTTVSPSVHFQPMGMAISAECLFVMTQPPQRVV